MATAPPASPAAPLNVGLGTPFQAQIDYLRQKLRLPTERWDEIQGAALDRAFVVAGAAKADLLADLHQAVIRGAEGGGYRAFQKDFKSIVAQHGWSGWTGEGSKEGVAWRTRVIYQTNMASSYAAGRFNQMNDPEVKKLHPYWRYIHSDAVLNPRQQHVAWSGLTLLADHDFWKTHFPPNGFGCQCRIVSVTKKEGEASARAGADDLPPGWDTPNPATGAPPGIGKGFAYAPGRSWHPNLDKYPFELAREVVADNLKDGVLDRWVEHIGTRALAALALPDNAGKKVQDISLAIRKNLSTGERVAVAVMDAKSLLALQVAPDVESATGYATQTVWFSDDTAIKQALHRTGQELPLGGYARLQDIMDRAEYVETNELSRLLYYQDGGDIAVAVIKVAANARELYLVSMRKSSKRELTAAIDAGRAVAWRP